MSTRKIGKASLSGSGERPVDSGQDAKSPSTSSPSPPNGLVARIKPVTSPRTSMKLLAMQHLANVYVANKQQKSSGTGPTTSKPNGAVHKHAERRAPIEQPFEPIDPALEIPFDENDDDELYSFIDSGNNAALRNVE